MRSRRFAVIAFASLVIHGPANVSGSTAPSTSSSATAHWAFQPIRNPDPPPVNDNSLALTSIDHFLLHQLEANGLSYSPPADRRTLIRRATFDLIGLPPTPEETVKFLADPSPEAYAAVIDRLLASPHYGEQWGRHWLDVARYADNKGYVFFEEKNYPWAYTYRDYVIDAFNRDLPFNRFILEQLAADQLDLGENREPLAAMGFLTLGGRFMNSLHDILDDRIDVTTRGLLGLTASCARCHDHKFDPIPQADYYSLYGIFRGSTEPTLPPLFRPAPNTDQYRKFDEEMKRRLDHLDQFVDRVHGTILSNAHDRVAEYLLAAQAERTAPSTENFMLITDKGDLNPSVIHRWATYLGQKKEDPVWIPWTRLSDLPPQGWAGHSAVLIDQFTPDAVNRIVLESLRQSPPLSITNLAERYAELFHRSCGTLPCALRHAPHPETTDDPDARELHRVLHDPDAPGNIPRQLGWGFLSLLPDRATQDEFKKLIKEVETWSMTGPGAPPRAMVLVDNEHPYHPRIFTRGNPNRPGKPVPRRFLSAIDRGGRAFTQGSGRLELARAIVDPANPLTARVIVNRIWEHHFGRGLVATPSDFGLRSAPPSHPRLLDHLAATFIADGWSIKKLHRRIMLSAAYRQTSVGHGHGMAIDPENRWLWKFNRRRLQFESTRDTLLAVSGSLDRTVGGPPVQLLGDAFNGRRTVYGFIDRMDLPGLYRAFDFPDPAATCPKRDQTTIAPQALYFMNHPFIAACAQRLLQRPDVAACPDSAARTRRVYQLLFNRDPTRDEFRVAQEFVDDGSDSPDLWIQYLQALLMTNELVFVD